MRYLFLIVVLAVVCVVCVRMISVTPSEMAVTQQMDASSPRPSPGATASPSTNALKAPLDRTRAVLDQVRKQNAADQF